MGQTSTLVLWFWGVGQATCIGLATWCLLKMGTRLAPAVRARIALWSLWLMCCAPVLMLLPIEGIQLGNLKASPDTDRPPVDAAPRSQSPDSSVTIDWDQVMLAAANWFVIVVDEPQAVTATAPTPTRWSWSAWALGWIVASIAFGGLKVIGGLWQIHALRENARTCSDQRLLRIGRECLTALQVETPVQWLQHHAIGTPAVVGLRRQAIILPDECCTWSDEQLRCALAHELAHIKRHDVIATLAAQVALVLNYFHPIGHILVSRMRLDQELAADCLAAPLVGGHRAYLETLAALALHRAPTRTSGPALAFLPAPRTFVRRLEMLRNLRLASSKATRWQAIVLPLCVVFVALTAMFLRPTFAQVPVDAQSKARPTLGDGTQTETRTEPQGKAAPGEQLAVAQAADSLPDLLSYLPDAACVGVLTVDVEKLVQTKQLSAILSQLPPEQRVIMLPHLKLTIDDVESMMLIVSALDRPSNIAVAVRVKPGKPLPQQPENENPLQRKIYGFVPETIELDSRTILIGPKSEEMRPLLLIAAAAGDRGELKDAVRRHPESAIRGAVHISRLRPVVERLAEKIGFLGPLWRDVTMASIGLKLDERLELQATLDTQQPGPVRDTLQAVKTLARNALNSPGDEREPSRVRPAHALMMLHMVRDLGNSALENVTISEQPTAVQVTTHLEQPTPALVSLIVPAIQEARQASTRAVTANSLKQIALAMHHYHDTHKRFPPAIITENGVERSWRVELLPFLNQQQLYKQYRKDEPWDGPNNKQLSMIQVPVYAPLAVSTATSADPSLTPIRGIGGSSGVLGKVGRGIIDITDGTSNTLMFVHVKELVPWTKPEEYAPTPEQLLQAAGQANGFYGAFADGSVRFLSTSMAPNVLRALMTINGGETIPPIP